MELLVGVMDFGLNTKKLLITIKLKSVETFSGVFALPIPHG